MRGGRERKHIYFRGFPPVWMFGRPGTKEKKEGDEMNLLLPPLDFDSASIQGPRDVEMRCCGDGAVAAADDYFFPLRPNPSKLPSIEVHTLTDGCSYPCRARPFVRV